MIDGVPSTLTGARSLPGDRLVRINAIVVALWLAATLPIAIAARGPDVPPALGIAHAFALIIAMAFVPERRDTGETFRALRAWCPLLLGPFLYVELAWLIPAWGRPRLDALIVGWEGWLFSGNPAFTLSARLPSRTVSEAFHLSYLAYYPILYLPAALLWFRGRRAAFATVVLSIVTVVAVCYTSFLLFPVDGPRYDGAAAGTPDGPFRTFTHALLDRAASRGTAFPSLHVAASIAVTGCLLRLAPRLGAACALTTAALVVATVYGGFHYAVDVVAGAIVGVAGALTALAAGGRRAPAIPGAGTRSEATSQ